MPRKAQHHVAFSPDGRQVTGYGTKKEVESLALLISHPSFGTGQKVCVYRRSLIKSGRQKILVSCWKGGRKVKK